MKIGPNTRRRRRIHLARLVFWVANLIVIDAMYVFARPLFEAVSIPYLLNVSVAALIEGAWSSYAADSPLDE